MSSLCASCGLMITSDSSLCQHHASPSDDGFSDTNRILCGLLHRGTQPRRLTPEEREEQPCVVQPEDAAG